MEKKIVVLRAQLSEALMIIPTESVKNVLIFLIIIIITIIIITVKVSIKLKEMLNYGLTGYLTHVRMDFLKNYTT